MNNPALMELAERILLIAADVETMTVVLPPVGQRNITKRVADLREAATQLRTAAAEGGEAVAYVGDSGKLRWVAAYPMQIGMQLYLHPPTDSGAGRDGERYRALRDAVVAGEGPAFQIFKSSERPETAEEMDTLCDTAIAGAAGEG